MKGRSAFLAIILAVCASLHPQETAVPGTDDGTAADADAGAAAAETGKGDAFVESDPGGTDKPGKITWNARKAFTPSDLFISDTVQVIINADEERFLESGPSPILNMIGGGTVFPIGSSFSIAPRIDFYSTYYDYIDGRAMPIEVENRLAIVYGAILDLAVRYDLPFKERHAIQFTAGPAFLLRAAFRAAKVPEDEQGAVDSVADYLWGGGRFIYPELGVSYSYRMADWVKFGVSARVLLPVFNLWTGEGLPFADNLIWGGGIWITFTDFWRKPKK
jgi:hypothetical protein